MEVASVVAALTDDKSLPGEVRKRLQIEQADKKSAHAALAKMEDKASNVCAVRGNPTTDWSDERRAEYLKWAKDVVEGLKEVPVSALNELEKVLVRGRIM